MDGCREYIYRFGWMDGVMGDTVFKMKHKNSTSKKLVFKYCTVKLAILLSRDVYSRNM